MIRDALRIQKEVVCYYFSIILTCWETETHSNKKECIKNDVCMDSKSHEKLLYFSVENKLIWCNYFNIGWFQYRFIKKFKRIV